VSAPILDDSSQVRAVLAVSGPVDRFGSDPGSKFGEIILLAARDAARRLRDVGILTAVPT
jgi:DNA-binding IclR family transcriptional regulator